MDKSLLILSIDEDKNVDVKIVDYEHYLTKCSFSSLSKIRNKFCDKNIKNIEDV